MQRLLQVVRMLSPETDAVPAQLLPQVVPGQLLSETGREVLSRRPLPACQLQLVSQAHVGAMRINVEC